MLRALRSLRPVLVLAACSFLLHCSSFGSSPTTEDGGTADTGAADGGAVEGGPADASPTMDATPADGGGQVVTFVEARTTTSTSGNRISPALPAPAKVGDALLGFWLASSPTSAPATGWETSGTANLGDGATIAYLWVGSHVVTAEDLAAPAPFTFIQKNDQRQEVTLVAFRGARQVDPANPVKVEVSPDTSGALTGLPFTTSPSGPSRAIFAFASVYDNTGFSKAPAGFTEIARTTGSLVVFQQNQMMAASSDVVPPTIMVPPIGQAGNVAIGVVAAAP